MNKTNSEKQNNKNFYIGILVVFIILSSVYSFIGKIMPQYSATTSAVVPSSSANTSSTLAVQNIVATDLTNVVTTTTTVENSFPLVQELTNSTQPVTQLVYEDADLSFFENSVFVGDSITVGFETYCLTHSDSIMTDSTAFLARVSCSAKAAVSDNALTTHANVMPQYNGQVQLIEDSISQMTNIERVFLCFGVNDLVGCAPEEYINNIQILVSRILEKNPNVSIYMISIPSVVSSVSTGYLNNESIQTANTLLQATCAQNQWGYINLTEYLINDTYAIQQQFSSDGYVHENNLAYDIWNKVLKNYAYEGKTS